MIRRFASPESLSENAVFRLLTWRRRTHSIARRLRAENGEIYLLGVQGMVFILFSAILHSALIAGLWAWLWPAVPAIVIVFLAIIFGADYFQKKKRVPRADIFEFLRVSIFGDVPAAALEDLLASPLQKEDYAAGLLACALAARRIRTQQWIAGFCFVAGWWIILKVPIASAPLMNSLLFLVFLSGLSLTLSRYAAGSVISHYLGRMRLAKADLVKIGDEQIYSQTATLNGVVFFFFMMFANPGFSRTSASHPIAWAIGISILAFLFGETWGYFVKRFAAANYKELVSTFGFVLEDLRGDRIELDESRIPLKEVQTI